MGTHDHDTTHDRGVDERRTVDTRSEEIYADNDARVRRDMTMTRFGGVDVPATFVGALVALALTAILGAVAGAVLGTTVFGNATIQSSDVVPAAIVGGLVLALAYFFGGWAAGRVARYNGTRNGIVAAVWTILLALGAGAAASTWGDRFDVLSGVGLPNWLSSEEAVMGGAVAAVVAIVLMTLFAAIGGRRGETYHRRADAHLVEPRYHGA